VHRPALPAVLAATLLALLPGPGGATPFTVDPTTGAIVVHAARAGLLSGFAHDHRLLAERSRPMADVWWSGEFAQTLTLAQEGALAPYRSPSAADLPEAMRPADALWTGFGGRARVILVNTEQLAPADYPRSVLDFVDARYRPETAAVANPVFGTAATHAGALYAALGDAVAGQYYADLARSGVRVVDGNSVVRDLVAGGQAAYGLTDTDDACAALADGAPVAIVFPDQEPSGLGAFVVPNTVAKVAGAPHGEAAHRLIDYLLSASVTADLVEAGWFHIAGRDVAATPPCVDASGVRAMDVSLADVGARIETVKAEMSRLFVR
jgi:iron(III) transport system substrate-binding protein